MTIENDLKQAPSLILNHLKLSETEAMVILGDADSMRATVVVFGAVARQRRIHGGAWGRWWIDVINDSAPLPHRLAM